MSCYSHHSTCMLVYVMISKMSSIGSSCSIESWRSRWIIINVMTARLKGAGIKARFDSNGLQPPPSRMARM